jgi:hypothetical protein
MRDKYRRLYEVNVRCRTREANLTKTVKLLTNDILAERISFEKVKTDEME